VLVSRVLARDLFVRLFRSCCELSQPSDERSSALRQSYNPIWLQHCIARDSRFGSREAASREAAAKGQRERLRRPSGGGGEGASECIDARSTMDGAQEVVNCMCEVSSYNGRFLGVAALGLSVTTLISSAVVLATPMATSSGFCSEGLLTVESGGVVSQLSIAAFAMALLATTAAGVGKLMAYSRAWLLAFYLTVLVISFELGCLIKISMYADEVDWCAGLGMMIFTIVAAVPAAALFVKASRTLPAAPGSFKPSDTSGPAGTSGPARV
jgi:hypothetical protein